MTVRCGRRQCLTGGWVLALAIPRPYHALVRRIGLVLGTFLAGGCVERIVAVRTEPPGATVYVDGERVGETPCEVKYVWYGTREIAVERRGFKPVREWLALRPPWWQIFPLDFVTEVLIPFTLTDRLEVEYVLEPLPPASPADREEMRRRAEELRRKVGGP